MRLVVVIDIPEGSMSEERTEAEYLAEIAEAQAEAREHGGAIHLVTDPRRQAQVLRAVRGRA